MRRRNYVMNLCKRVQKPLFDRKVLRIVCANFPAPCCRARDIARLAVLAHNNSEKKGTRFYHSACLFVVMCEKPKILRYSKAMGKH